jgi:hypothetical protein
MAMVMVIVMVMDSDGGHTAHQPHRAEGSLTHVLQSSVVPYGPRLHVHCAASSALCAVWTHMDCHTAMQGESMIRLACCLVHSHRHRRIALSQHDSSRIACRSSMRRSWMHRRGMLVGHMCWCRRPMMMRIGMSACLSAKTKKTEKTKRTRLKGCGPEDGNVGPLAVPLKHPPCVTLLHQPHAGSALHEAQSA